MQSAAKWACWFCNGYFKYTISSMMSELRMPEILLACPKVVGRTRSSFCRDSAEREGMEP